MNRNQKEWEISVVASVFLIWPIVVLEMKAATYNMWEVWGLFLAVSVIEIIFKPILKLFLYMAKNDIIRYIKGSPPQVKP